MEFEQSTTIKYLHFKMMKITQTHRELTSCFVDDAHTPASVKYCMHEFKTGRVSKEDGPRPGRVPLDHIDAAIVKRLLIAPFSSVQTLTNDLDIRIVMIWEHMIIPLGLQCRNFNWASEMITNELRMELANGAYPHAPQNRIFREEDSATFSKNSQKVPYD
jgi:hypothetical protein